MKKSRGIFLVSVMFVAMLAAMFVGAALELAPGGLGRARQNGESLMAQKASRSGIEYALTRLRQDARWCGASNRVVVDTPDFFVTENDGMVIGWLKDSSGSVGQFRIRFNLIDGSPGADGLPDPAAPFDFSYPYVSVNNLMGNSETTSRATDGTDRVIVPAHAVYLAVEGRAGRGLSGLDSANFNPGQTFSSVTPCTIECIQRVTNLGPPVDQAVVMGGGNVSLRLRDPAGKVQIDATSSGALVRMRSKGDIAVEDGASPNVDAPNAVLLANNVSANLPGTGVTVDVEDPAAEFYKIPASDVHTADGTHTLMGGTYTVDQNGNVDYYDMPLATYLERMSDPATAATTLPTVASFTFNGSVASLSSPAAGQYELTISGDLLVEPSTTGQQDLAIIPKRGAKASRADGGGGGGGGGIYTIPGDTTVAPVAANFVMGGDANHYLSSTADNVFYATVAQTAGLSNTIAWGGGGEVTGQIQWGGGAITNLQASGSVYSNFDNVAGNFPHIYTAIANAVGSDPNLFDQFPGQLSMWGYTTAGGGGAGGGGTGGGTGGVATEVTDTLTTRNLTLNLQPPAPGGSVTLSSPGDLVIGATLNGTGATLVSGRDIRIIGTGLDLSSEPGASRGLSMYANGNISVSTYTEDLSGASAVDAYRDFSVTGTVYANQGFSAVVGEEDVGYKSFNLRGALVAYGGDPATGNPGSAGTVDITAASSNLIFDPAYLMDLYENLPGGLKLEPLTWNVR